MFINTLNRLIYMIIFQIFEKDLWYTSKLDTAFQKPVNWSIIGKENSVDLLHIPVGNIQNVAIILSPLVYKKKSTKIARSTAFILVVNEDFLYFLQKISWRISDYIHFTHTRGMWKPHRAYTHSYTYKACIHLCTYSIWFYFFSYVIFRHKLLAAKYKYTYLIQEFLSTYS